MKKMTRQEAVKLSEHLNEMGFRLFFDEKNGKSENIPMSASRKEGERNVGEWLTYTKVTFMRNGAHHLWVVVAISVYNYQGSATIDTLKTQTSISTVEEFDKVFAARERLHGLRNDFYL